MPTVPGDPNEGDNVVQMLPKWMHPTMADFLQAVAIMQKRGRLDSPKAITPPTDEHLNAPTMGIRG